MIKDIVRIALQHRVDFYQCGLQITATEQIVDYDTAQDKIVRLAYQQRSSFKCSVTPGRGIISHYGGPVIARSGKRQHALIFRSESGRLTCVAFQFVPVGGGKGDLRQRNARVQIIGVLFGQAQILAIGLLAVIAFIKKNIAHQAPRFAVAIVQLKHIPERHHCTVKIFLRRKGQSSLIIFLCPLFDGFARCQTQRQGQSKDEMYQTAK